MPPLDVLLFLLHCSFFLCQRYGCIVRVFQVLPALRTTVRGVGASRPVASAVWRERLDAVLLAQRQKEEAKQMYFHDFALGSFLGRSWVVIGRS